MKYGAPEENTDEHEELMSISDVIGLELPQKEPEIEEPEPPSPSNAYEAWKADPSQDNLAAAVNYFQPTIDSVLQTMGAGGNPHLAAKARVVTAKALMNYDPNYGASPATWISNQLRQLQREKRKSDSVLSVPDGVQLDAYTVYKAEREFEDEHGREPTLTELADASGIPVRRIRDVRKKMRRVGQETSADPEVQSEMAGAETDFSQDALDYVYNDSDTITKKIIEYTTGYNGEQPLSNAEIMKKLRLTPVQLTRLKAKVSLRVRDIIDDLESIQSVEPQS